MPPTPVSTTINAATGKSDAQVLAESTAAAEKAQATINAAGYKGPQYTPGVPGTQPNVQQTTTQVRSQANQNNSTLQNHLTTIAGTNAANANKALVTDPTGGKGTGSGTTVTITKDMDNGDGTRQVTYSDGTSARVQVTKNADGTESYKETGNTDESTPDPLTGQINDINAYAKKQLDFVNTTLDNLTASSDAASLAMVASIKAIYAARGKEMVDSNSRILAGKTTAGLRNGDARYASDLNNGILTDEEQQGITRLASLQAEGLKAVAEAQKAQTDEDLTLFNDKMDKIKSIQDDTTKQIADLHTAALNQQKADMQAASDKVTMANTQNNMQIASAKAASPALITELSSITDPKKKADLIQATADHLGIDPTILMGELSTAANTQQKADLDILNIKSEIANRGKNTTPTPAGGGVGAIQVGKNGLLTTASLTSLGAALTQGGDLGGQTYNPRGDDNFVDPGLYDTLYTNVREKFGAAAAQQFLTKYPPKTYINPDNADSTTLDPAISTAVRAAVNSKKPAASAPGI